MKEYISSLAQGGLRKAYILISISREPVSHNVYAAVIANDRATNRTHADRTDAIGIAICILNGSIGHRALEQHIAKVSNVNYTICRIQQTYTDRLISLKAIG